MKITAEQTPKKKIKIFPKPLKFLENSNLDFHSIIKMKGCPSQIVMNSQQVHECLKNQLIVGERIPKKTKEIRRLKTDLKKAGHQLYLKNNEVEKIRINNTNLQKDLDTEKKERERKRDLVFELTRKLRDTEMQLILAQEKLPKEKPKRVSEGGGHKDNHPLPGAPKFVTAGNLLDQSKSINGQNPMPYGRGNRGK